MKERPILFSAPMVRALLDGTKTQTRRVVKQQIVRDERFIGGFKLIGPGGVETAIGGPLAFFQSPYGLPGDRLWVRETFYAWGHWTKRRNKAKGREAWHFVDETAGAGKAYRYDADEKLPRRKRELHEVGWWKRPAIFMPRAAVRITLGITGVRVERLQDISEADSAAEGCAKNHNGYFWGGPHAVSGLKQMATARQAYRDLWESINGPDSWAANPWVWVVEFKHLEGQTT